MSFLDNLENNLKSLENAEQNRDEAERRGRTRDTERAEALAAAPYAEALKKGTFTAELLKQAVRIGFSMRTSQRVKGRGIWKRSMENGEERRISEVAVNWGQWAVSSNGIYYVDTTGPKPTIEFYNFADHKVSRIATLAKPLPPEESGFAVSPDGRRILYLQVESETDIMLVENFR